MYGRRGTVAKKAFNGHLDYFEELESNKYIAPIPAPTILTGPLNKKEKPDEPKKNLGVVTIPIPKDSFDPRKVSQAPFTPVTVNTDEEWMDTDNLLVDKKKGNDRPFKSQRPDNFLPLNHRTGPSQNTDPNYGWGSGDLEVGTIIPTSVNDNPSLESERHKT